MKNGQIYYQSIINVSDRNVCFYFDRHFPMRKETASKMKLLSFWSALRFRHVNLNAQLITP